MLEVREFSQSNIKDMSTRSYVTYQVCTLNIILYKYIYIYICVNNVNVIKLYRSIYEFAQVFNLEFLF